MMHTDSERLAKPVQVQDMTEAEYAAALVQAGLPEPFAKVLADSDARAAEGWLFDDTRTLENAIGRVTSPLQDTLALALRG